MILISAEILIVLGEIICFLIIKIFSHKDGKLFILTRIIHTPMELSVSDSV